MGVNQTLHRISALKNRYGDVCGLTYRIGRHVPGMSPFYDPLKLPYTLSGIALSLSY